MKQSKYELKYKEFIAINKRLDEIQEELRRVPSKPVTPYQRGWYVILTLRDDYKRRSDAERMQFALDLVMNPETTFNVELIKAVRRFKNWADALYHVYPRDMFRHNNWSLMRPIDKKQYDLLKPDIQKFFYAYFPWEFNTRISKEARDTPKYKLNTDMVRTEPKVIKRIVTREIGLDSSLLAEQAFLRKKQSDMGLDFWEGYNKRHNGGAVRAAMRAEIKKFLTNEKEDLINPEQQYDIKELWY